MKSFNILFILLGILAAGDDTVLTKLYSDYDINKALNAMQIIRKYGYPAEAHTIQTKDGYLLELNRIHHGRNIQPSKERLPILIQHGLLCSSADFLLLGQNSSLPFILADMGFDVWMGNVRGNTYSRAHVSINPNENQFWDFTWHESGIYDVSAQIDFILEYTNHTKLIYIGHSMGTTMFFVMNSMLPEYNDKIEVALLMAPVAYLKHCRSPLLNFFAPLSKELEILVRFFDHGEFLPKTRFIEKMGELLCGKAIEADFCLNLLFLVFGDDPREINKDVMELIIYHFPAGYSVKAITHFSQLIKSGDFRQYDYGSKKNMEIYNQSFPPDYQIENIRAPMFFYMGKNDYLSTIPDVKRLASQLSTLRNIFYVNYPKFAHMNFLIDKNVKTEVFDRMIQDLLNHLRGKDDPKKWTNPEWAEGDTEVESESKTILNEAFKPSVIAESITKYLNNKGVDLAVKQNLNSEAEISVFPPGLGIQKVRRLRYRFREHMSIQ